MTPASRLLPITALAFASWLILGLAIRAAAWGG